MKALVLTLVVVMSMALALSDETRGDARMDTLAKKYSHASNDRAKITVCVEAIDSGFIRPGAPLVNVDRIFGTAFLRQLPTMGQTTRGFIDFGAPAPSRTTGRAPVGDWHFAVAYNSSGLVTEYWLTNVPE